MQNFGDISDKYLMVDVLLLCCVFVSFRKTSLQNVGLDPAQYYTSPGLSWDAFLKQSGVKLEIIKDNDIYNFFENIRGGFTCAIKRYSRANNEYQLGYNENEPS